MIPNCRWYQFSLRTLLVAAMIAAAVPAYVGSYYRLSRRGTREAKTYEIEGFLYVRFDEAAATADLSKHYRLAAIYAPLNWLDRKLFGSDPPTACIMWRLE